MKTSKKLFQQNLRSIKSPYSSQYKRKLNEKTTTKKGLHIHHYGNAV